MEQATTPTRENPLLLVQDRSLRGINEFVHLEVSGSVVLLIATIVALVLANSPLADAYFQFW